MTLATTGLWAGVLCEECANSNHRKCDADRACRCGCNFAGGSLRELDTDEEYVRSFGAVITWPGGRP